YDPEKKAYVPFAEIAARSDQRLGALPAQAKPWKAVMGMADKPAFLEAFFRELRGLKTLGADLAKRYGRRAKEIGLELVAEKVAAREEDVNTVLLTGFYHAYGPVNTYFD
ncbi:MAG: hypothetical protein OEW05_04860, partial [Candidatus Aminicenantes bacterium]|nr:hypothetical protein [Candidatus Aminicenantes bacterium]